MSRMFLLFSHELFMEQITDAQQNWGVEKFINLPPDLQAKFSQVPTDIETVADYGKPFLEWLNQQNIISHDYVLIQGEYGLTYWLTSRCKARNWRVIYTTTARKIMSEDNNTAIISRLIQPQSFRYYEN